MDQLVSGDRRRVRILHVQLFPMLSGVQRVTLEELRRLDPAQFECHLLTCERGPLTEEAERLGVICHTEPALKRSISPLHDYIAYRRLRSWMAGQAFDLVHTHSSKTGVLGRMAAAAVNVPCVVHTVHGFAFPGARSALMRSVYRWCERRCARVTDGLVCLNDEDFRISTEELAAPPSQVHVLPNGVDLSVFQPVTDSESRWQQRAERLPGVPERPVVMMVGRLWAQKNPLAFVEAAIRMLEAGSPAEFYLVGDGTLRQALKARIDQSGFTNRIHLLGWRDDVPQLLPLADVMVLPSLWEGMPLVLLEAEACGVPVVASDIPGNRDCVDDGIDGFLVPKNNLDQLVSRIAQLVENPQLAEKMGAAARQKVQQYFTIEHRHQRILTLYSDLLDRPDLVAGHRNVDAVAVPVGATVDGLYHHALPRERQTIAAGI